LKRLKKIVLGFVVFIGFLIGSCGLFIWYYQDKWINLIINEANQYVASKVEIGKVHLNAFEHFPKISLEINAIKIYEPRTDSSIVAATVGKLGVDFDFWKFWNGKYEVNSIQISDANLNLIT